MNTASNTIIMSAVNNARTRDKNYVTKLIAGYVADVKELYKEQNR